MLLRNPAQWSVSGGGGVGAGAGAGGEAVSTSCPGSKPAVYLLARCWLKCIYMFYIYSHLLRTLVFTQFISECHFSVYSTAFLLQKWRLDMAFCPERYNSVITELWVIWNRLKIHRTFSVRYIGYCTKWAAARENMFFGICGQVRLKPA